MTDAWKKAALELSDEEIKHALANALENANEPAAGIIRQLLGDEKTPLSPKQQHVYEKYILPSLVERCGNTGCLNFVPAGTNYCPTCEIEYGS